MAVEVFWGGSARVRCMLKRFRHAARRVMDMMMRQRESSKQQRVAALVT